MLEYLIRIAADGRQIAAESTKAAQALGQVEAAAKKAETAVAGAMAGGAVGGGKAGGSKLGAWALGVGKAGLYGLLAQLGIGSLNQAIGGTWNRMGMFQDLADETGLSTTQLQQWDYAAQQSGKSIMDVLQAFEFFKLSQKDAADDPSGAKAKIFASFGLDSKSMANMPQGNLFEFMLDSMAARGTGPENIDAARELFGRGGARLLRVGRNGLRSVGADAPIVGEDVIARLDEQGDWMNRQKLRMQTGFANVLGAGGRELRGGENMQTIDAVSTSSPSGSVIRLLQATAETLTKIERNTADGNQTLKEAL